MNDERSALRQKIEFYVNSMISVLGADGVKRKTAPLIEHVVQLDQKITQLENRDRSQEILSPSEMCDRLESRCREVLESLGSMDREQIRHLLKNVITEMTVDMETRETTLSVSLPSWAIPGANDLCAVEGTCLSPFNCAYNVSNVLLGTFACKQTTTKRPFCMVCKRLPSSAPEMPLNLAA